MPPEIKFAFQYIGLILAGGLLHLWKHYEVEHFSWSAKVFWQLFFKFLGSVFSGTVFFYGADVFGASESVKLFALAVGAYLGIRAVDDIAITLFQKLNKLDPRDLLGEETKHGNDDYPRHRDRHRRPRYDRDNYDETPPNDWLEADFTNDLTEDDSQELPDENRNEYHDRND